MNKSLSITPIPAFSDNYLWLIAQDLAQNLPQDNAHNRGNAVVVDPGDAKPVLDYLNKNQLTLSAILITHHHHDHIGGIERLLNHNAVPVYGPDSPYIPQITHTVKEGDLVRLFDGELSLEVLEIPGHTKDHIAYYGEIDSKPVIFSGDTLFAAGCGRLFDGTHQQLCHSLLKLNELPEDTVIYCTHEYTLANLAFAQAVEPNNPEIEQRIEREQKKRSHNQPTVPTTLKLERATNPFLRFQSPTISDAINHHWQEHWTQTEDLFAGLRRWKDQF